MANYALRFESHRCNMRLHDGGVISVGPKCKRGKRMVEAGCCLTIAQELRELCHTSSSHETWHARDALQHVSDRVDGQCNARGQAFCHGTVILDGIVGTRTKYATVATHAGSVSRRCGRKLLGLQTNMRSFELVTL